MIYLWTGFDNTLSITELQKQRAGEMGCFFVRRDVTRPASKCAPLEDSVSDDDFDRALAAGQYVMEPSTPPVILSFLSDLQPYLCHVYWCAGAQSISNDVIVVVHDVLYTGTSSIGASMARGESYAPLNHLPMAVSFIPSLAAPNVCSLSSSDACRLVGACLDMVFCVRKLGSFYSCTRT